MHAKTEKHLIKHSLFIMHTVHRIYRLTKHKSQNIIGTWQCEYRMSQSHIFACLPFVSFFYSLCGRESEYIIFQYQFRPLLMRVIKESSYLHVSHIFDLYIISTNLFGSQAFCRTNLETLFNFKWIVLFSDEA